MGQNWRKNDYIYSTFGLKKHLKRTKNQKIYTIDKIKTVLATKNINKISMAPKNGT